MHALRGLDFVRVHPGDILVANNSTEKYCKHIEQVLNRLKKYGFIINFKRSKLGLTKVTFL